MTVSALFLAAAALPARAAGDAVPAATAHYRVERPAGEKAAGVAISARVVFPAAARPVDEVSVAGIPVRIPSPLAPAAVGDAGCEVAAVFAEEPQANGTLELVYDGVAFDDFPRDGRTDWGLGTGCTGEVTARLEIVNPFPFTLPEGEWTVFQRPERGAPRLFPPVRAPALRARQRTTLHLGAVPNLSGERVRLAITEIVPGSVLEERFAVTVRNAGDEPRAVKVVEHFYRGGLPRLAEADAPHELAGPGEISFRLHVPPRGEKSVNYTVQYTW